ncbi:MAG: carbohydrate ABC transporter permease [Halobacteriales archaeon]
MSGSTISARIDDLIAGVAGDRDIDWTPYGYVLPILLVYAVFVVYPIGYVLWMSFTDFLTVTQVEWVGLQNYQEVFTDDVFWTAMKNTVIYSFATFMTIVIGLGLALILDSDRIRGNTTIRSLIFLPYVLPIVVAAVLFSWMFAQFGIVNSVLIGIGLIEKPVGWLSSPTLALPTVMGMVIWKNIGFNMLIFLAGLQSIPDEVYEASKIAGKSRWAVFRHITLPLLKPSIVIVLILGLIGAIRGFAEIWVMTEGGPGHASETLGVYFYKVAFAASNFGKGAAIGYIMFAISIVLTIGVLRYSRD